VRTFAANPDVSFGDINLSQEPIRGNHNPGRGGWPTVKYFNKETGYEGAHYTKKTSEAMCTELGNDTHMNNYVLEAGHTSLCNAATFAGCSEKEKKFAEKFSAKSAEEVSKQTARLTRMAGKRMKPQLMEWISQRLAILKQLQGASDEAPKSEL
jgi:hypothetical protein